MHIISAIILAAIVYLMAGLHTNFFIWVGLNIFGILVGASLMQCIGTLSQTFEEANILMMLVMMLTMMMSSGFVREVPGFLEWMREISVMGLLADLCMYYEFHNVDSKYGTADEIFDKYAVKIKDEEGVVSAMMIMLAIYVVARVIAFLAVKFLF